MIYVYRCTGSFLSHIDILWSLPLKTLQAQIAGRDSNETRKREALSEYLFLLEEIYGRPSKEQIAADLAIATKKNDDKIASYETDLKALSDKHKRAKGNDAKILHKEIEKLKKRSEKRKAQKPTTDHWLNLYRVRSYFHEV